MGSAARRAIDVNMENNLRAVVVDAIYRKSLRLSTKARNEYTSGRINTMVDADVNFVITFPNMLIVLVTGITQIALGIYFTAMALGQATWVAIGVFLGCLVIVLALFPIFGSSMEMYMAAMDARTKRLREFLYGIKIVKFQAAEESLNKSIHAARDDQRSAIRKMIIPLVIIFAALIIQQQSMAPLAIIAFSAFGNTINGSNVFTIIGLLQAVSGPSGIIGSAFTAVIQFGISLKRLRSFLLAEETHPDELTARFAMDMSVDGSAILMDKASFTWEVVKKDAANAAEAKEEAKEAKKAAADAKKDAKKSKKDAANAKDASAETVVETQGSEEQEPFKLEDVNLSIPRGSLVAVVGSVGSGKSSFLSAVIGGMRKTAGSSSVFGSIAYCAQEPWILTGTIEENIVFSDESVRPNIAKAVSASCLEHDLEILPNGLGTQIGEKGINLSGGQKARVALARAIARDADIYLLDDPIAALDAHVGKKVFDEAICGTLKSKTVVLVTHQLHLLPKVDFVVVLDNGRVAETGTFKDLMAYPQSALSNIMKDYHFDDEVVTKDNAAIVTKDDDEQVIKAVKAYESEKAVDEDRRVGAVKLDTFRSYFVSAGYYYFGLLVILFLISSATSSMLQISLTVWADDKWGWTLADYYHLYIGLGVGESTVMRKLETPSPCRWISNWFAG
ncbi:P-loop containing nucleoside triphosphate hydrolase protein [Entophlyctis helioformis]|nr:P-loop containing nucleoside triphosphate hydrolase protein [Entophlyctis helioformis]